MSANLERGLCGLSVLIVDDEPDLRLGLRRLLAPLDVTIRDAESGKAALQLLARASADLVLTDVRMPGMSGVELLAQVKQHWPQTEVVVMSGYGTIEMAVACLQDGAAHFLAKPFDNQEIVRIVCRLGRQIMAAREDRSRRTPEIVAEDPRMLALLELVARVAKSPVAVLIEGESGTGKELVARAIHASSAAASSPFLAVNAAALPDTLLESELFGHVRGAFTGADRDRSGLFAEARRHRVPGRGELDVARVPGQAAARAAGEGGSPAGRRAHVPVDFRLVAATNRDLQAMIKNGEFREDLYYRLRVVRACRSRRCASVRATSCRCCVTSSRAPRAPGCEQRGARDLGGGARRAARASVAWQRARAGDTACSAP
ncbi:MAG: sigma 54-interacting transcriptional regulator [Planctomycetota bacterium]